jgi:hypothetical protein
VPYHLSHSDSLSHKFLTVKNFEITEHWWLTPVILATQEGEIRRLMAQSQPRKSLRDPISKIPNTKRAGGMSQGVGLEFKPQNDTHTHTHTHNSHPV